MSAVTTTEKPNIVLLPGQELIQDGGSWRVVERVERQTRTVSFRVTDSEYAAIIPFIDTFENASQAFRHLLFGEAAVRDLMRARVAGASRPAAARPPSPPTSA